MERKEFQKILAKALTIIDIGIEKGYFAENQREPLNKKLLTILNNGVEYDIPGIYHITGNKFIINNIIKEI